MKSTTKLILSVISSLILLWLSFYLADIFKIGYTNHYIMPYLITCMLAVISPLLYVIVEMHK